MKLFFQDSGYFDIKDKYKFTIIHRDYYNDKLDILKSHKQVLCVIKFENNKMEIF